MLKVTKGGDISVILGLVIIQKKWKVIKKMWWYIIILCIEKVSYYAVLGKRWKWKVCLQSYDIFKSGDADDVEKLKVKKWWERRVGDRHKKVFDLPSSDAQGVPWWKTPPIGFVTVSSKSPGCVILKVTLILIMLILKRHMSGNFCWCHMWKIILGCANSPASAADHSSYPDLSISDYDYVFDQSCQSPLCSDHVNCISVSNTDAFDWTLNWLVS